MKLLRSIAFGFAILMSAAIARHCDAADQPGISSTKPASGRFVKFDGGYMVPYKAKLPGSDVEFEMVPIPGGAFRMGSPAGEPGRQAVEGPQFAVKIPPFWMGQYEVTWQEYQEFMALLQTFQRFQAKRMRRVTKENDLDAVTAPTELYEPTFTYEKGEEPLQPAVTVTQYSARQYTKWLSLTSQLFYRLPTEAEWEYACRAGTKTAYFFGDDPAALGDYAWFAGNSGEMLNQVGQKKPNPWGLYDMHGNVSEWVMDELLDDGYARFEGKPQQQDAALVWPKKPYPRVVRGGNWWRSSAAECRSASRLGSHDEDWKDADPNEPLSPWWFTSDPARGVGFRLVRQLDIPDRQAREKYWKADAEMIILDVQARLEDGRGIKGLVDPQLPADIEKLNK